MFDGPEFSGPPECPVCLRSRQHSYGCREDRTIRFADGGVREPVAYGEEEEFQPFESQPVAPCDRCNVMPEHFHHPGCPNEVCPKCGGRYIECPCATDEKLRVLDGWTSEKDGRHSRR
ncbi:hypothetical protein [Haloarchaeobius sp. HRN-SO-5]|uniref:hypothetical protein n=1 Tax=Haloarchaeobius sp. HRN-SO-5 TaxID=3446118 RepID=UPI003EC118D0